MKQKTTKKDKYKNQNFVNNCKQSKQQTIPSIDSFFFLQLFVASSF